MEVISATHDMQRSANWAFDSCSSLSVEHECTLHLFFILVALWWKYKHERSRSKFIWSWALLSCHSFRSRLRPRQFGASGGSDYGKLEPSIVTSGWFRMLGKQSSISYVVLTVDSKESGGVCSLSYSELKIWGGKNLISWRKVEMSFSKIGSVSEIHVA